MRCTHTQVIQFWSKPGTKRQRMGPRDPEAEERQLGTQSCIKRVKLRAMEKNQGQLSYSSSSKKERKILSRSKQGYPHTLERVSSSLPQFPLRTPTRGTITDHSAIINSTRIRNPRRGWINRKAANLFNDSPAIRRFLRLLTLPRNPDFLRNS